ncbi:ATP-binding protein [Hymenobacter sp. J193]|uniref:ATP-binding protein n=1 Tax=Hymenobacter sp. J193 TaxID=2898429 RepID=UPI002151EDEC|nr:ATP-binding protein [Hymenobacter sp. J193]MCR5888694.1 ATP-binding protein [Hymenobacter sp. J193]
MLRISLTGPESTGKTTLSQQLADHYGTVWAPEFAREYLERQGAHYTLDDLEAIARGQMAAEDAAAARAHRVVFCDTDLLVIKIWSEHAFGYCPEWISQEMERRRYDLVLLLDVDLPWYPDPLREHPNLRQHFHDLYRSELEDGPSPFADINGEPARRFEQACFLVDELLAATYGPAGRIS